MVPDDPVVLPTIIVGSLVIVFGLPFFSVANISLYSKITDEKTQGKKVFARSGTGQKLFTISFLAKMVKNGQFISYCAVDITLLFKCVYVQLDFEEFVVII